MTLRWYKLFHKAWTEHPPGDWLLAAQIGYVSPTDRMDTAIENTRRMFDAMTGMEAQSKKNAEKKS